MTLGKRNRENEVDISNGHRSRGSWFVEDRNMPQWFDGKIVRLSCEDFLTFENTSINFGPGLNLIVGANGSGKSSVVSAICLGFAAPTKVLGRASKLRDFIKHGKKSAKIELEVYRKDKKNVILHRRLTETSSFWKLNGKGASNEEVEKIVNKFNIQLSNLTQFLPQEKVASFASMGPVELLNRTEEAILSPSALEARKQLIEKQQDFKTQKFRMVALSQKIDQEKRKNDFIEQDVQQFIERKALLAKIEQLKVKKTCLRFSDGQVELRGIMDEKSRLAQELSEHQEKLKPITEKLDVIVKNIERLRRSESGSVSALNSSYTMFQKVKQELEREVTTLRNLHKQISMNKKEQAQQKKTIEKLEHQIAKEEEELKKSSDSNHIEKIKELQQVREEIYKQLSSLEEKKHASQTQIRGIDNEIRQYQHSIRELDNEMKQRMRTIESRNRNAFQAYKFVEANKNKFAGEIYFMPMNVNVKNKFHAQCFETVVGQNIMFSFICADPNDRDILMKEFQKRQFYATVLHPDPNERHIQRVPRQQLNSYGIDCYMDEVVEINNNFVRNALLDMAQLHRIVISSNPNVDISKVYTELNLGSVLTKDTYFTTKTGRFSNKTITRSDRLKDAKIFKGVDMSEKENLIRGIEKLEGQKKVHHEQMSAIEPEMQDFRNQSTVLDQKIRTFRQSEKKYKSREKLLANLKRDLYKRRNRSYDQVLKALETKRSSSIAKKLELLRKQRDSVEKWFKLSTELELIPLKLKALDREKQAFQVQNAEYMRMMTRLKSEKESLEAAHNHCQRNLSTLRSQAKKEMDEYCLNHKIPIEELKERLRELPDVMSELENQILQKKIAADSINDNERIVEEYNQRAKLIEKLKSQLSEIESSCENQFEIMNALKEKWYVPLREHMQIISDTFQQYCHNVGIAGEVGLIENEDYTKYEIQIKVKFRKQENLMVLTKNRQSGGERSLTTMIYLLSMQQVNQAPFRVVDEINQGMDPINERKIFHQILFSATGAQSPQSFLITPKLLPKLVPDDANNVNVIVIYNGPRNLPDVQMRKSLSLLHEQLEEMNSDSSS